MNLIEELGLKECQAIVDGAPETATGFLNEKYYEEWSHNGWVVSVNGQWEDCKKPSGLMIDINDLRTAIAEHDSREFKVGDLVVCTDDFEGRRDLTAKDIALFITVKRITAFIDDWGLDLNNGEHWVDTYRFRHATPKEIKAGHRIDSITDHCSDIRNHVSPNTKVIER